MKLFVKRSEIYKTKQQDTVSLCSPSIQHCERQMYFYWADYLRAHCPAVRDALPQLHSSSLLSDVYEALSSVHGVSSPNGVVSLILADDLCYTRQGGYVCICAEKLIIMDTDDKNPAHSGGWYLKVIAMQRVSCIWWAEIMVNQQLCVV